jgi:CMD domain protein
MTDLIDDVAGLSEGSAVHALRRARPEILRLSQTSFEAALRPQESGSLTRAERAALAVRMARQFADDRLAAAYAALLEADTAPPDVAALADPAAAVPADPRHAAIVRHVDLVSLTPEAAVPAGIARLKEAGITDRDIVTLTGLIAFVNYQIRVAAGLRMLEGRP